MFHFLIKLKYLKLIIKWNTILHYDNIDNTIRNLPHIRFILNHNIKLIYV